MVVTTNVPCQREARSILGARMWIVAGATAWRSLTVRNAAVGEIAWSVVVSEMCLAV